MQGRVLVCVLIYLSIYYFHQNLLFVNCIYFNNLLFVYFTTMNKCNFSYDFVSILVLEINRYVTIADGIYRQAEN